MNNLTQFPPHIRTKESNQTMMMDVIIAMIPLYAMACFFYGTRVLYLLGISVLVSYVVDILCVLIGRKVPNIRDMSAIVTGMMIPLLMPATIRVEILCAAVIFAIIVAKHPFGGVGQNIFNPSVAGVAFAIVCWPKSMFAYSQPLEKLPLIIPETIKIVNSPAKTLMLSGIPTQDMQTMLLGNSPGAIGTTHILVLITCLMFLVVRKTINLPVSASFIAGAAVFAAIFPRAHMNSFESIAYELMSGFILLSAIFLINDPVTSPKREIPGIIYGAAGGVLCMMFRYIGRFEESALFAILIMNSSVWIIDLWGEKIAHNIRRKEIEINKDKKIQEKYEADLGPVSK